MHDVETHGSSEAIRDRARAERACEEPASEERRDVAELVTLIALGLGPLACFAAFGTGSGIEMGLGSVVALAAARGLALTLRPSRFHDALEREHMGYRLPAGPGAETDGWDEEGWT